LFGTTRNNKRNFSVSKPRYKSDFAGHKAGVPTATQTFEKAAAFTALVWTEENTAEHVMEGLST